MFDDLNLHRMLTGSNSLKNFYQVASDAAIWWTPCSLCHDTDGERQESEAIGNQRGASSSSHLMRRAMRQHDWPSFHGPAGWCSSGQDGSNWALRGVNVSDPMARHLQALAERPGYPCSPRRELQGDRATFRVEHAVDDFVEVEHRRSEVFLLRDVVAEALEMELWPALITA